MSNSLPVCPVCGGPPINDRGPLDAPHCRDCGWEFDTQESQFYDTNYSFIFPYRLGKTANRLTQKRTAL